LLSQYHAGISGSTGVHQRNFNLGTSSKRSASSPDRFHPEKCLWHKPDRWLGVPGHSRVRHFLLFIELLCFLHHFFFSIIPPPRHHHYHRHQQQQQAAAAAETFSACYYE
jgi:hypothetical protein